MSGSSWTVNEAAVEMGGLDHKRSTSKEERREEDGKTFSETHNAPTRASLWWGHPYFFPWGVAGLRAGHPPCKKLASGGDGPPPEVFRSPSDHVMVRMTAATAGRGGAVLLPLFRCQLGSGRVRRGLLTGLSRFCEFQCVRKL